MTHSRHHKRTKVIFQTRQQKIFVPLVNSGLLNRCCNSVCIVINRFFWVTANVCVISPFFLVKDCSWLFIDCKIQKSYRRWFYFHDFEMNRANILFIHAEQHFHRIIPVNSAIISYAAHRKKQSSEKQFLIEPFSWKIDVKTLFSIHSLANQQVFCSFCPLYVGLRKKHFFPLAVYIFCNNSPF